MPTQAWVLLACLGWHVQHCTYVCTHVLLTKAFAGHSRLLGVGYVLVHVCVHALQAWGQDAYLKAEVILNVILLQV
jgi:hypothetical protein